MPAIGKNWARLGAGCAILAVAGLAVLVMMVVEIELRMPAKMQAVNTDAWPRLSDAAALPVLQFENHTCGLLALSAAYRKYGLAPDAENLRLRLGVDAPGNPLDASTTGTVHPDIFRVLAQDHFQFRLLDPAAADARAAARAHLAAGHVLLVLIARPRSGMLHWVLADGAVTEDQLRIVDSLFPEPYLEPMAEYFDRAALSVIAIEPAGPEAAPAANPHLSGTAEMLRVQQRLTTRRAGVQTPAGSDK